MKIRDSVAKIQTFSYAVCSSDRYPIELYKTSCRSVILDAIKEYVPMHFRLTKYVVRNFWNTYLKKRLAQEVYN